MKMHLTLLILGFVISASEQTKTKRQIYREQVLPLSGGKIPEDAFRADRLALNRLNKEGIAVPDGILLEHRSVHSHPHENKHDPEDEDSVLKIVQQQENRYAPEEGTYHNHRPLTVASTYLIRKPIGREETNILTPDQQMPLHQALYYKEHRGHYSNRQYQTPRYQPPPRPIHPPQRFYYNEPKDHVAYNPIPVPFVLPNQDIQDEKYFLKNVDSIYPNNELTGHIQFPLIFKSFENNDHVFDRDFQTFLPSQFDFGHQESFPFYSHTESFGPFRSFYSTVNGRFERKSTEDYPRDMKRERLAQRSAQKNSKRTSPRKHSHVD